MLERACFAISRAHAHGSARECLTRAFARVRIKIAMRACTVHRVT